MRKNQIVVFLPILFFMISACGGKRVKHADRQATGEELFTNYICNTCHSLDGSEMYGPTLKDIYGKEITVIRDGKEHRVTVNRKYLRRSIQDPDYEKLQGFEERVMPQPQISESDVEILVEYLLSQ